MIKINLGDEVKDSISGFQGIAITRHSYLNGCDRISVQPKMGKDGKLPEMATFDEPQLTVMKAKKVPQGPKNTGGPERYMPTAKPTGNR